MAAAPDKPTGLQATLERYGTAALYTWFGIFFSTIALFAALISIGIDVDAFVTTVAGWFGMDASWVSDTSTEGRTGLAFFMAKFFPTLLVAYLAAQAVKPVRIALFLAATPAVARWMGHEEHAAPEDAQDAEEHAVPEDSEADGEPS